MGSCILNYTRNQFCGGRKPECPEETLEVRLRSTETRSTYNFVVEVEGVIDVHYASLTSQGVQHRVFYRDGHSSRYQPRPTGLNFGEQTGTGVFPLVRAVPACLHATITACLHATGTPNEQLMEELTYQIDLNFFDCWFLFSQYRSCDDAWEV